MTEDRISDKLEKYKQALARLEEALAEQEPDQFIYDATIKRFEFTYELAWKLLKAVIEYKGGKDVLFPRDIFKESFANGILKNGEVWLEMLKDRNLSSHTYNQEMARDVYHRIRNKYFAEFLGLVGIVEGELKK